MKKILLFVLFLVSFVGFGQCPTNAPIRFNTQAQVDSFIIDYPNCTEIYDNVVVSGTDISNLNGLRNITAVYGGLYFSQNPLLNNFEGLDNLTYADVFSVIGLQGLTSFNGLLSLTSVGSLKIEYTNVLEDLSGLENLTSITEKLEIGISASLVSLNGLENLETVGWKINIGFNNSLTSIDGLRNVQPPTEFSISTNQNLSQCAIESVCRQIALNPFQVRIVGNAPGCNSTAEVEAQCQLSITEADLSENLSLFPNPVASNLNIEISKDISFEKAKIYSTLGKLILETSESQINLETLSAGIYFVEMVTDKGSFTKKIIKE